MKCTDLAKRIEELRPGASVQDVARLCLLLSNASHSVDDLSDEQSLARASNEVDMRLRAATDQHAAMAADLECLQSLDFCGMSHDQIWRLVATIKAQSRILQLYLGGPKMSDC